MHLSHPLSCPPQWHPTAMLPPASLCDLSSTHASEPLTPWSTSHTFPDSPHIPVPTRLRYGSVRPRLPSLIVVPEPESLPSPTNHYPSGSTLLPARVYPSLIPNGLVHLPSSHPVVPSGYSNRRTSVSVVYHFFRFLFRRIYTALLDF